MQKSIELHWKDRGGIHKADLKGDLNGALTLALSIQSECLGLVVIQQLHVNGEWQEPERIYERKERFDVN